MGASTTQLSTPILSISLKIHQVLCRSIMHKCSYHGGQGLSSQYLVRGDRGNPQVFFAIPLPVPANTIPMRVRVRVHCGNAWVHRYRHGVAPLFPTEAPVAHSRAMAQLVAHGGCIVGCGGQPSPSQRLREARGPGGGLASSSARYPPNEQLLVAW